MKWRYGDAGDRYPVKDGDIWTVGPCILACGDLERGDGLALMHRYGKPDLIYVDPPWNLGNAKAFRTKAEQTMPEGATFETLLDRIMEVARFAGCEAWIEMGNATVGVLWSAVARHGGQVLATWPIFYGTSTKNPCQLMRTTFGAPVASLDGMSPEGMNDQDTPEWVIERCTKVGDTVLDVCGGRGLTVACAADADRIGMSLEMNPRRMAVGIDRLVEEDDDEWQAKLVGSLI